MNQITPAQPAERLKDQARPAPLLLDVREPWEFELCAIAGARNIPMGSIPMRQQELEPDAEIVVICHHGARSMQVAMFLERAGFSDLTNLTGGVDLWATQVDPTMARY